MLRQRKLDIGDMDVETLENKVYSKVLPRPSRSASEMHAAAPAATPRAWCVHSYAVGGWEQGCGGRGAPAGLMRARCRL